MNDQLTGSKDGKSSVNRLNQNSSSLDSKCGSNLDAKNQFADNLNPVTQLASQQTPNQNQNGGNNGASKPTSKTENKTGLPDNLKSGIEGLSGYSMDDVKVHYNSSKPDQLQALAYAQGTDIHVGPGQEQHLPHEAWHVVQQKQGRVKPTRHMKSKMDINDDPALEKEADVMGREAVNYTDGGQEVNPVAIGQNLVGPIQRKPMNVAITGITHLVYAQDESVFEGVEKQEVSEGDILEIETEDGYMSRRGPNQEIYREVDRTGPQHYEWVRVLKVNGGKVGKDIYVRTDTYRTPEENENTEKDPWLIFGMNGRNEEQVRAAVKAGYRRFDCAESYDTTKHLINVLKEVSTKRSEFEIIYKFDVNQSDEETDVLAHLAQVAKGFGGYVDAVIIHNVDTAKNEQATQQALSIAWKAINRLKERKMIYRAGLGNITAQNEGTIKSLAEIAPVDLVENSVESLLIDDKLRDIIKEQGADVLFYDVLHTLSSMGMGTEDDIRGLVSKLSTDLSGVNTNMILSSGNQDRQVSNLTNFGEGNDRGEFDWENVNKGLAIDKIYKWQNLPRTINYNDESWKLPVHVAELINKIGFGNNVRKEIHQDAETQAVSCNKSFILNWLKTHQIEGSPVLTDDELNNIKVPARNGLKRMFFNVKLADILDDLFSTKNCYYERAVQMLALMNSSVEDWNNFLVTVSGEIVENE